MKSGMRIEPADELQAKCTLHISDPKECAGDTKKLVIPLHENSTTVITLCAGHRWQLWKLLEENR